MSDCVLHTRRVGVVQLASLRVREWSEAEVKKNGPFLNESWSDFHSSGARRPAVSRPRVKCVEIRSKIEKRWPVFHTLRESRRPNSSIDADVALAWCYGNVLCLPGLACFAGSSLAFTHRVLDCPASCDSRIPFEPSQKSELETVSWCSCNQCRDRLALDSPP